MYQISASDPAPCGHPSCPFRGITLCGRPAAGQLRRGADRPDGVAFHLPAAPVVYLSTDTDLGVVESVRKNAGTVASIFGLEGESEALMEGFAGRIEALREAAAGKTAVVGMCTSGSFNVLGNEGRCSIIGREIGFENVGAAAESSASTHGSEASFEYLVSKDPGFIFVLDRDAAIASEGAKLAQEIMENELVMRTTAYQNGRVIYLAHPTA